MKRISFIGSMIYHCLPIRRSIVLSNISRVFRGNIDTSDQKDVAKRFYSHMWSFVKELTQSTFFRKEHGIRVENLQQMQDYLDEGKGLLWLTCHLGNWETAFVDFMREHPKYQGKVTLIRKRLRPPWLDQKITRRFEDVGVQILKPERMAIRTVLKKLRQNEIVVFVLDQHASTHLATRAEFFGHPVNFSKALARLALHTGAPVIPAVTWREQDSRHVVHFGQAIPAQESPQLDEAIQNTTQAYNNALESFIRQHPEQWFCLAHRLWKVPKVESAPT